MSLPRRSKLAHRARILVDALESRTLLTTPGDIQPETFSTFDKGERQALIARMTNLPSRSSMASKIGKGKSSQLRAFDDALLSYMQTRTNVSYTFANGDQKRIGDTIKANLGGSKAVGHGDDIVDRRMFESSTNASSYDTKVSGNIDYRAPNGDKGGTFSLTMNRFEYWDDLADAVWLGSNPAKYTNELTYELARWSQQFDGKVDAPADWSDDGRGGWTLVTSIRAEMWTDAYFKLNSKDNASWGGADNTLMLYKLMQTGDWLYNYSQSDYARAHTDSNKSIGLAKSLYLLGKMFPELDAAATWEKTGRELLFDSMNDQIYADGSDREQSPGYAFGVMEDVVTVYNLDRINGTADAWDGGPHDTLKHLVEANRQFLDPNGKRPGIGDTYRTNSTGAFLIAGTVLGTIRPTSTIARQSRSTTDASLTVADASKINVGDALTVADRGELLRVIAKNGNTLTVERGYGTTTARSSVDGAIVYDLGQQPFTRASIDDVWALGVNATTPFLHVNGDGVLGARGKAYAMPDSGNYILRSDDSNSATQVTFDSGPKGGVHGHNDLLNFELWSGGRPLIVDPGPYKYDDGDDRDYVVSTRAHNTVNVDGKNTGAAEGADNPAITASHDFGKTSATVQGTHSAYAYLEGQPVLSRAIWYDYGDTMLVVDFAESSTAHSFSQSFNVPGTSDANVTGTSGGSEFKTRFAAGDNVRVKTINGGSLSKGGKTFVTGDSSSGYKSDAYRYTVTKDGQTFAVFVTLVNVYTGLAVPNVDAKLLTSDPQPGQAVQVQLTRDGKATQTLTFQQPPLERPSSSLNLHAAVSDFAYDDAGNLHLAYQDLEDQYLRYTVKSAATGKWSPVVTVDDSAHGVGASIDVALDNEQRPAIAYYDAANGDMKYAVISSENDAWRTTTVDAKGTTGQNPSLTFSRKGNTALISYYNRTKRDLKVAEQQSQNSWSVRTFDGDGDVGRYSQISLDANRTDLNARYVIAYADNDRDAFKFASLSGSWKTDVIRPKNVTAIGGHLSLAWQDTGEGSVGGVGADRYQPRFTFSESQPDESLWFASRDKDGDWSSRRIDGGGSAKSVGDYSQLSYATGNAEVFYFDSKKGQLRHGTADDNDDWTFTVVGDGGREAHVGRYKKKWTVISANDDGDLLSLRTVS